MNLQLDDPHDSPVVRLVQDIAAQFRHLGTGEAATRVADHIVTFWDPRMRAQLANAAIDPTDELLVAIADRLR